MNSNLVIEAMTLKLMLNIAWGFVSLVAFAGIGAELREVVHRLNDMGSIAMSMDMIAMRLRRIEQLHEQTLAEFRSSSPSTGITTKTQPGEN